MAQIDDARGQKRNVGACRGSAGIGGCERVSELVNSIDVGGGRERPLVEMACEVGMVHGKGSVCDDGRERMCAHVVWQQW